MDKKILKIQDRSQKWLESESWMHNKRYENRLSILLCVFQEPTIISV